MKILVLFNSGTTMELSASLDGITAIAEMADSNEIAGWEYLS